MKKKTILSLALSACLLSSCYTPNVVYFNDVQDGQKEEVLKKSDIYIQPEDKLSIVVNSKDPLLADLFNLPVISHRVGYTQASSMNSSQQMSVYTVDSKGEIDFPVLGKVHVAGLRREEVAEHIKQELMTRNLVNDPVLTVEYANLAVNVLGEVNKPGRYTFDRDHLTILDAISMAGDLTIYGQRENITVQRKENGEWATYKVNLLSGNDLYASPVFYLQQNDIVYIAPNDYRARQATVNGNNVRSTSFWISLASLLTSVAVLIFK